MARIFKYQLDLNTHESRGGAALVSVEMPEDAKVLSVGVQHGNVCVWAEVDTTADTEMREFLLVGTGNVPPEDAKFLATVMLHNECLVLHVYEEQN